MSMAALDGGLAEPVLGAQRAFRTIMEALANPGTSRPFADAVVAPLGMSTELALVALTLCDHDTPVWIDPHLRAAGVNDWLRFHTSAPLTDRPGDAAFAFAAKAGGLPHLSDFALGTDEYPDRSTTLVLAVPTLSGGSRLVARGPGILGSRAISPLGLPADFPAQWADNRELFPRGIDLLLCAPGELMGLPRSTRATSEG